MKSRILHINLSLIGALFWFSACALADQKIEVQATAQTYPNELVVNDSFKIVRGGWFNIASFESQMAEKKETLRGMNAPNDVLAQFDAMLPTTRPLEIKMGQEIKKQNFAFYTLGFYINDGTDIMVSQKAFHFRFLAPDSSIVEADDLGCLFVYYNGNTTKAYDSARGNVVFNKHFDNKPDYKKRPNVVYARLPNKYSKCQLIGLDIDMSKIRVAGSLVAKTP